MGAVRAKRRRRSRCWVLRNAVRVVGGLGAAYRLAVLNL